ncbi:MAG: hypothetical protein MR239_01775 [Clostridiales bacterium]|nr:hypothetical protein [Clostridiales bacterium]MDY4655882.1 hypothetical protein [Eubacteriales bacterium]
MDKKYPLGWVGGIYKDLFTDKNGIELLSYSVIYLISITPKSLILAINSAL